MVVKKTPTAHRIRRLINYLFLPAAEGFSHFTGFLQGHLDDWMLAGFQAATIFIIVVFGRIRTVA